MTKETTTKAVVIKAPNFEQAEFIVEGTAPLVVHRFANKSQIMAAQAAGSQARSRTKREPKDFDKVFRESCHISEEGWYGVHAAGIRQACIDACRLTGFHMTKAKSSVFILHDGVSQDGYPLVRIDAPAPERHEAIARNDTGVPDIRVRPMWRKWRLKLRMRWDADQFSAEDVVNLLARAGEQIGICEGRPFSKNSAGQGWGTFRVVTDEPAMKRQKR